ncbi:MAG: hypothetical protein LQ349_007944 [Xanthoria aureola]|nr:MAG: hypothetical protein LQ349_007944 [Xanthoria aureola]
MLPELLAGSYKRYKQDTAVFTTWLAQAGSSVGYNPNGTKHPPSQQPEPVAAEPAQSALPKGARLKGKARKAAKDAAAKVKEPNVGTSESQAPSTMPASLRVVVERAVRARQRCSEWFQKSGVRNQYAEKQHTYFISILERSLKILEPCLQSKTAGPEQQTQNGPLLESSNVNNRFSSLKLEETPEADPTEVSEIAAAINIPAKTAASADESEIATYELEDEDEFDEKLAYIIFCFFEDLYRTQDFVNELWRNYKAKKFDLYTAAVTTNAAFDLVRQTEEDLITQAPAILDKKRSYDSIAIIVFYADAFQQGICPETRLKSIESLQTTPFDDFVYLLTAKILMKFTFIADLPVGCDPLYPAPCPPLRFSYTWRPDLLGTAEMDRKEREDSMLSQLIIDRQLWNTHKQVAGSAFSPPPPEDELGESLNRLTKKGVLSAALVFEARIYLDIQDIIGDDVSRGHQDLLRNTKMIDKIMNLKVIDGAWDVGGTGERWHERDVDVVMRIKQTSINCILDPPTNAFPKFKTIYLATHPSEEGALFQASGLGPSRHNSTPRQQVDPPERSRPEKSLHSKAMPSKNSKLSSLTIRHHRIPEGLDPGNPAIPNILRKQLAEEGVVPDDEPL